MIRATININGVGGPRGGAFARSRRTAAEARCQPAAARA
jgi:hypothetical protein